MRFCFDYKEHKLVEGDGAISNQLFKILEEWVYSLEVKLDYIT